MTPLIKIGQIYFKREDQNITGSAKDRAISLIIDEIVKNNFKEAVISSTGNAAISAQYHCNRSNIKLTCFVSKKINPDKLKILNNPILSDKPISDAFKFAKANNAFLIRLSTNSFSKSGYQQIGKEIREQLPQATSIFVPTGSGATAFGIASEFKNVCIVQPASHCPLASHYDKNFAPETETITDALGAKLLPLKKHIFKEIPHGVVVQNQDVINAQNFLIKNNITTSPEGALALAGYYKIKESAGDYPVIILTGAKR